MQWVCLITWVLYLIRGYTVSSVILKGRLAFTNYGHRSLRSNIRFLVGGRAHTSALTPILIYDSETSIVHRYTEAVGV